MQRLSVDAIYNLLNYNWWQDSQLFSGGATWQSAELYYQDQAGNIDFFGSSGVCPENPDGSVDASTRENYIKGYLMWETARQLFNGQCVGNITNSRPATFQPMPIYFK